MIRRLALTAGLFLVLAGPAAAAPDITGTWMRGDGDARVEIVPCGDQLCATNVWVSGANEGEAVGDRLVMNVSADGANQLSGRAYDEKRDRSYSMTVTVGNGSMETRGCVLGGLLCASESWTRQ